MMLTMQEFMELVDYKITDGGDYTYDPFGPMNGRINADIVILKVFK